MTTTVDARVHRDHVTIRIDNPHPTNPCIVWIEGRSRGQGVSETIVCDPGDVEGFTYDMRFESQGEAWDFSSVRATVHALRWGGDASNDEHWVTAVSAGGLDIGPQGVSIALSLEPGQRDIELTIDVGVTPHGHTIRASAFEGPDQVASVESQQSTREATVSLLLPWFSTMDRRASVEYEVCVEVEWADPPWWSDFAPITPVNRCMMVEWFAWSGQIANRRLSVDAMVALGDVLYTLSGDTVSALDRHLQLLWTRTLDADLSTDCSVSANALLETPVGVLAVINRGYCAPGPFGSTRTWLMAAVITPTGLVQWRGDLGLPPREAGSAMQIVRNGPARFGLVTCDTTTFTYGDCSTVDLDVTTGRLAISECPLAVGGQDRIAFDPARERVFLVAQNAALGRSAGMHSIDCATGITRSRPESYPYGQYYRFIQTTANGVTVLEADNIRIGTVILSEFGADASLTEMDRFDLGRSYRDEVSYVDLGSRIGHVVCAASTGSPTTCAARIVPLDGSPAQERPFTGGHVFHSNDTSASIVALGASNATFVYGSGVVARIGVTP